MSLHSLKIALCSYKRNIQAIIKAKELDESSTFKTINNGFTLLDLARQANDMFGKVLALDYISVMIMNIVGIFASLSMVTAFSNTEPALICLSISGFFIVILNMIKLYSYTHIGQALSKAYFDINNGLEELLLLDGIRGRLRRELELLVHRFSITSPIRPLDMFDMNSANFAVILNIMLTYVVILMQFKGSF